MNTLHKVQVNTAQTKFKQLILHAQVNYRDLLASDASSDVITDADNPHSKTNTSETTQ